ncbi:MAG TPA: AarF/ABC1/UbiB kinase family protein [Gaiellaceae bacterium]|nr:AarF/ABC1/UbiB kinase family protein [Gaiellaceae bacterium]
MSSRPAVRQLGRLSEIAQIAAKHGFGYLFDSRRDGRGPRLLSRRQREVEPVPDEGSTRGQRLRNMLDELGPTFVKFGQLLSTRPDVVPPDVVFELKALQDAVSPFPFEDVERVVREDFGLAIDQLFLEFDEVPVASASIGQVHRAVLPNGRRVVVKVQRPEAPRQVEADLELLYQAARFAREHVKALEFVDTVSLVDEFARTIRQELDYRQEARNAEQFHRNFAGHPHVRIPRVYWSYSRARVLTLERLDGVHVRDLDLSEYSLDERRRLAHLTAEVWMAMIFRHGFFHADPHPSNIMVLEQRDQIGLVDFGMAGKLTPDDMSKLTALFIDAVNENIEAFPRRLASLGVRYPKELESEFVAELRDVYYRYYGARLSEIDAIQVIREAFGVIYRMRLQLPTRFMLLDRAIATLASVGQGLYPDFNVFEVAKPYARELMVERFTPHRVAARTQAELRNYLSMAREFPYQLHDVLQEFRDGEMEIQFRHRGLDQLTTSMDLVFNRLTIAIISAAGLVSSSLIGIFADAGPRVFGLHLISVMGFSLSALLGLWLIIGVIRSGRL